MYKVHFKIILFLLFCITSIPFIYFFNLNTTSATNLKQISYQNNIKVSGIIEAGEATSISLSYPVFIKECYVKENSFVNKGQLMFVLDTDKMQKAIDSYNFSNTDYSNIYINNMFDVPSEIYATESGVVHDIVAYAGNIVMADETMCVIDNTEELMLKITLDQYNYSKIMVGDKIIFSPTVAPSREYSGTVTDKTAVVRKEASLIGSKTVVDIFADIDICDEYITSGLQFTGTVINSDIKPILTLPYEYINQDDNGEYVNIFSKGVIDKKYIETGIETESDVEIITQFPLNTVFVKNNGKGNTLIEHFD